MINTGLNSTQQIKVILVALVAFIVAIPLVAIVPMAELKKDVIDKASVKVLAHVTLGGPNEIAKYEEEVQKAQQNIKDLYFFILKEMAEAESGIADTVQMDINIQKKMDEWSSLLQGSKRTVDRQQISINVWNSLLNEIQTWTKKINKCSSRHEQLPTIPSWDELKHTHNERVYTAFKKLRAEKKVKKPEPQPDDESKEEEEEKKEEEKEEKKNELISEDDKIGAIVDALCDNAQHYTTCDYCSVVGSCPASQGICIFIPTSKDNLDEDVARAIQEYEQWTTQWKKMLGDKCWLTTMTKNKGVNWKEAYAHLTPTQKASRREFTEINKDEREYLIFGDPPIKDIEVEVHYLHDGLNLVCSLVHGRFYNQMFHCNSMLCAHIDSVAGLIYVNSKCNMREHNKKHDCRVFGLAIKMKARGRATLVYDRKSQTPRWKLVGLKLYQQGNSGPFRTRIAIAWHCHTCRYRNAHNGNYMDIKYEPSKYGHGPSKKKN